MAHIGVGIDPGYHQVQVFHQAQHGQSNTIRGRAIAGEGRAAVLQLNFLHPQRAVQGFDMAGGRPVAVRRQHTDLTDLAEGFHQREQPWCCHAIIIGHQNMGHNRSPVDLFAKDA